MSQPPIPPPPLPATGNQVRIWIRDLAEQVAAGQRDPAELVALLGQVRDADAAYGHATDYLVMAAREQGATLRGIGSVIGRGYVRPPAARLERLSRSWHTAAELAAAITTRITDDQGERAMSDAENAIGCANRDRFAGRSCVQRLANGWIGAGDLCGPCTRRFMTALDGLGEPLDWHDGYVQRAAVTEGDPSRPVTPGRHT